MTRNRLRKLKRTRPFERSHLAVSGVPLAAAIIASISPAHAQQNDEGVLESVIVTAQKRSEDLQEVPLSIQAIDTTKLEQLHVTDFEDYVRFLPSVSYTTFGPGFAQVYMRGVASGGDGNHSGSLPSVGMYLDEQPITTIQGPLDIHVYDIARVEALAGPQGTLYGASSQAGTLRIITNKPDASAFSAGYDLEGNTISDGGSGYVAEGHVNIPLSTNAAIRLVGWKKHDPGYIDNVVRERTFPDTGIVASNAGHKKDDYNDADTTGGRAALKLDLNDSWTVTPAIMGQEQKSSGTFGFDPSVGELQVAHKYPEKAKDRWWQAALTVEGKIANLDLVYAGSYLKRDVDTQSDYSDYSYWYDVAYFAAYQEDPSGDLFGTFFYDNDGDLIDPSQYIQGKDRYKRYSHELRLASPAENRLRFVAGLFMQRQEHGIEQRYRIDNLADSLEVPGWADTLWLTQQERVDKDSAVFGEVSFDITEKLTATGGLRYFETENSLKGFFGFGAGFSSSTGEVACFDDSDFNGAPCRNLDKTVKESDSIHKLNLAYKFDDERMMYATWSRGFRPGGINRRGSLPPYTSDFLTNYEIGWKTTWAGNRLRFNGAVFSEEWEDFQFSLLGENGLTEIKNANQARINGLEVDVSWAASRSLTLAGGFSLLDSELTENYCGFVDDNGNPATDCAEPEAPKGTELPVAPKFKSNLTARYEFPLGNFDAHVQGSAIYVGERWADVRIFERGIIGKLSSYTVADFSAGLGNGSYSLELFISNAFDERAEITRFAQCAEAVCGLQTYVVTNQPRGFGLRFGQKF